MTGAEVSDEGIMTVPPGARVEDPIMKAELELAVIVLPSAVMTGTITEDVEMIFILGFGLLGPVGGDTVVVGMMTAAPLLISEGDTELGLGGPTSMNDEVGLIIFGTVMWGKGTPTTGIDVEVAET